ncbi:hypothetical protein Sfulv_05140 [Streptomyces fulvorobeus]|uniref:Secreted protein n=1 Tax=Streptomyces fulvorobeus TaxID=284028 RepID=A0A7J0C186_9ACTN|nr:hypothetical protein Sfulv_05140 [Streptomyces fulvorobeus]
MTSLHTTRVRRRRLGVAAAAAGLFATLLTAGTAVATPDPGDAPTTRKGVSAGQEAEAEAAIRSGEIPGVDEIVHSPNIKHLANVPKDALQGTNSDLAFQGKYAFSGNYDGFVIYDISKPSSPKTVAQVLCPGGQNDITVSGDLLFLSTDSSRSDDSCASTSQPATEKSSWEGMKIFDISDKKNPQYVAAVETACGSHTHTLVPSVRTCTCTSPRTRRTRRSPTASRRMTGSPSSRCRATPREGPDRELPGALPGRREPGRDDQPGRLRDDRLPRHHRAALEGPRRRSLHG